MFLPTPEAVISLCVPHLTITLFSFSLHLSSPPLPSTSRFSFSLSYPPLPSTSRFSLPRFPLSHLFFLPFFLSYLCHSDFSLRQACLSAVFVCCARVFVSQHFLLMRGWCQSCCHSAPPPTPPPAVAVVTVILMAVDRSICEDREKLSPQFSVLDGTYTG